MTSRFLIASPDLIKWLKLEGGVKLPDTDDIYEETAWLCLERRKIIANPQTLFEMKAMVKKTLRGLKL